MMKIKEELKFTGKEQMPAFEVFFFLIFLISVILLPKSQPINPGWNIRETTEWKILTDVPSPQIMDCFFLTILVLSKMSLQLLYGP